VNSSGHASVNILEDKAVILINVPLQAFKDIDVSPDSMGLTRKIQLQKNELIRQLDAAISLSWDSEQGVVSDDQIAVVLSSDPQHPLLQIEWLRYLKLSPAAMTQTVLLKVDSAWLVVRRQLPCPVGDNYLDRLTDM